MSRHRKPQECHGWRRLRKCIKIVTFLTVLRKTPPAGKYEGYFYFEQTQLYLHVALSVRIWPQCTVGTFKCLGPSRTNKLYPRRRSRSSSVKGLLLKQFGDCALHRRHPGRYLLYKRAPYRASVEYLFLLTWLTQRNLQLLSGKLRSRSRVHGHF